MYLTKHAYLACVAGVGLGYIGWQIRLEQNGLSDAAERAAERMSQIRGFTRSKCICTLLQILLQHTNTGARPIPAMAALLCALLVALLAGEMSMSAYAQLSSSSQGARGNTMLRAYI